MVTVVLWAFYVLGFLIWFSPFYLWAFFFSSHREEAFQRLNHRFYRSFFTLLRALVGVSPQTAPAELHRLLRHAVDDLCPAPGADVLTWLARLLSAPAERTLRSRPSLWQIAQGS